MLLLGTATRARRGVGGASLFLFSTAGFRAFITVLALSTEAAVVVRFFFFCSGIWSVFMGCMVIFRSLKAGVTVLARCAHEDKSRPYETFLSVS